MPNFLSKQVNQSTETLCDWVAKYNSLLADLQLSEFLLKAGDTVPEDFFIRGSEFSTGEWIELRMKNAMGAEIFLGRNGDDDLQHGLIVNGGNKQIFPIGDAKIGYYWPFNDKTWGQLEQSEFTSKGTLFRGVLSSDMSGFFDLSPYYKSRELGFVIDNMLGDLTVFDPMVAEGYKLKLRPYQTDAPVRNLLLQKPIGHSIKFRNNSSLSVSRPNSNELLIGIPQGNYNILIESQMIDGIAFVEINEYQ